MTTAQHQVAVGALLTLHLEHVATLLAVVRALQRVVLDVPHLQRRQVWLSSPHTSPTFDHTVAHLAAHSIAHRHLLESKQVYDQRVLRLKPRIVMVRAS